MNGVSPENAKLDLNSSDPLVSFGLATIDVGVISTFSTNVWRKKP